ncbi:unannotated protein [freshwater metagenome]|uniref:Unannotated protein n=1 Tax=freshwater metagenome TaxID=449393 RepID=A0A6J6YNI9_9ZZZZ|nr:hypothetical protein [Actinomycetota bacterium]MSW25420.1 hypothetical protein [Actinomycetota bacterium]MSX30056.1 hypothetical protein [Actinomycetota bacterium]MSX97770.1 hypothetical protein [Actinomycetota bacterium]MSZ78936.1 hypothetical protein [Actinomycetota bacterium]
MSFNTYVDESVRDNFLLCGVNIVQSLIPGTRDALRELKPTDRSHIHMYRERRATQIAVADFVSNLPISCWLITVSTATAKEPLARPMALSALSKMGSLRGSRLLTLDDTSARRVDSQILREVARGVNYQFPHYRHMNSRHEPLLWLPDIIAWCYGRGGTWRDSVEPLVTEVIEL